MTLLPGEMVVGLTARPFPNVNVFCVTLLLVAPTAATVYIPFGLEGTLKLPLIVPELPACTEVTMVPVAGPL